MVNLSQFRVLLATIRDGGTCPCPTCRILKKDIEQLGTQKDMRLRQKLARQDNLDRQSRVKQARKLIHHDNAVSVTSTKVEALLKGESLVPIEVTFAYSAANVKY